MFMVEALEIVEKNIPRLRKRRRAVNLRQRRLTGIIKAFSNQ